jgi:hypothetical protein
MNLDLLCDCLEYFLSYLIRSSPVIFWFLAVQFARERRSRRTHSDRSRPEDSPLWDRDLDG